MVQFRNVYASILSLLLSTGAVIGAETSQPPFTLADMTSEVPDHPDITYYDLMRQLVTDLVPNETIAVGHTMTPPRHILGLPFAVEIPERITLGSVQMRPLQAKGENFLLVLTTLGPPNDAPYATTILAAFTDAAVPKLVDAVDVAMDKTTRFGTPGAVWIGKRDQAIVTTSQHSNDTQSFAADALIFMRNERLELIDVFHRFGEVGCGFTRTQTLSVEGWLAAQRGPYGDIAVTINDDGFPADNNCLQSRGEAPYSTKAMAIYHWNEATNMFSADTSEIDRLKDITGQRY